MRILVQRVKSAGVTVDRQKIAGIGKGLLLFVGIGKDDVEDDLEYLSKKISGLRIFEDEQGRMNLDIQQARGEVLSVSQFTLYADTKKGNRPGFDGAADPETAEEYWERFNMLLKEKGLKVEKGRFGAHMEVDLVNEGPVTLWLESNKRSS